MNIWKPVLICRDDGTCRIAHAIDGDGGWELLQKIILMPRQRPISVALAWALRWEYLSEAIEVGDWRRMRLLQSARFLKLLEKEGFHIEIDWEDISIFHADVD